MIASVIAFNQEVLGVQPKQQVTKLSWDDMWFTMKALNEEKEEFAQAWNDNDTVGQVDALLDSIYFALGALYKMGLSEQQIKETFDTVHLANMGKRAGISTKRNEEVTDAVKPEDWVSPEYQIRRILWLDTEDPE